MIHKIKKTINFFLYKFYLRLNGVKLINKRTKLTFSNSTSLFYSQENQDVIALELIRKTINDNKIIKIIDIGSNHPIKYNNTLLFEKNFKSEIYSIDAQSEFKPLYLEYRNCKFIDCAIGKHREEIKFYVPQGSNHSHDNNMFASADLNNIPTNQKDNIKEMIVTKKPLIDVVPTGDYDVLFIDVEGFELDVLYGIDFVKFYFKVVIIENNREPKIVSQIRNVMKNAGYCWISRIDGLDDIFIKK
jgi:FkbM family methyltransferase